jgi:hypothetical protein
MIREKEKCKNTIIKLIIKIIRFICSDNKMTNAFFMYIADEFKINRRHDDMEKLHENKSK